ncbi:ribonuclease H-like domain-containing protein, partial [Tanacetum coccineum]
GEYDMWKLRIEQYFQVQDCALWDVIENGNSFKPATQTTTHADGSSTTLIPGPVTSDEKTQKKNDVKARSMLLMALPNEHLLTFNQYKDAKTLFAAIQTRFGGNDATKKTQKKQMCENFSAPSIEYFDYIFNRLQKIVSQLAILGENISQEDLSLKFLRISTASTQVSTANLSDATVYEFLANQPNGSQLVHEDLEQIHEDELEEIDLKWQLALLSMRTRKFFQKTTRKITISGSDIVRYDKSKVECFNCHKLGHFARECRGPRNQDNRSRNQDSSRRTINVDEISSKAMLVIDGLVLTGALWQMKNLDKLIGSQIPDKSKKGLGFVSYNAVPPPSTGLFSPPNLDLSNSGLEEFQQPEFKGYGPKTSKSVSEDTFNEVRESPDALLVEELVSNDKLKKKNIFPTVAKINFVRPQQQEKPVRKPANYNYHQKEWMVSGNNYTWVNYNYSAKKALPSAYRNIVPKAVLMKTSLRPLNTARPVNTAHPKTTVYSARPMSCFSKSAQSTIKRPYQIKTTLTNKNFSLKVNTAKGIFYTAKPKAVNTARPNSVVVNAIRENQSHPQIEDQEYVDSGCSRHMTGNMSYLSDFKEFDGGYVTFGGGAKGGRITGKGTLKTGKLDFEDLYFVREL